MGACVRGGQALVAVVGGGGVFCGEGRSGG